MKKCCLCATLVDVSNILKIQALVKLISEEVPFELNANKLAGSLEIGRDTVVEYLKYLGDAKVFNLLYSDKKKMGKLSKQDKVNRCREEEMIIH